MHASHRRPPLSLQAASPVISVSCGYGFLFGRAAGEF